MQMGEVLGSIICTQQNDNLCGLKLKIVRLYEKGKPGKVIVAGDAMCTAENGDFVHLVSSIEAVQAFAQEGMSVDLAIMGFVDEYSSPYSKIAN